MKRSLASGPVEFLPFPYSDVPFANFCQELELIARVDGVPFRIEQFTFQGVSEYVEERALRRVPPADLFNHHVEDFARNLAIPSLLFVNYHDEVVGIGLSDGL